MAEQLYQRAQAAFEFGDTDEAQELVDRALAADPTLVDAWILKARLLPATMVDEKYEVLEQILQLDPNNAFANEEWDRLNAMLSGGGVNESVAAVPAQPAALRNDLLGELGMDDPLDDDDGDVGGASFSLPTSMPSMPSMEFDMDDSREKATAAAGVARERALELVGRARTYLQEDGGEEVAPGISQKLARTIGAGLAAYTLFCCCMTMMIVTINNSRASGAIVRETERVAGLTQTLVAFGQQRTSEAVLTQTMAAEAATMTQAVITPSLTPTRDVDAGLPTALPPTATTTPIPQRVQALPPPDLGLTGRLLAFGGFDPASREYLEMRLYNFNNLENWDTTYEVLGDWSINNPTSDILLQRIVGDLIRPGSRDVVAASIASNNIGQLQLVLSESFGAEIDDINNPVISPTGNQVVFIGSPFAQEQKQIYLYDFNSQEVTRITNDTAEYLEAAVAPNLNYVVAVKRTNTGTDLVAIDLQSGDAPNFAQIPLTNDGNALVERTPRYAPSGSFVVFAAAPAGRAFHDIYEANIFERSVRQVAGSPEYDDFYPIVSPDSRFIAYASDANELNYNIFVHDRNTGLDFQITTYESEPVYPVAWSN